MPDAIQPVGAMIQPPDPSKGLSTISGILGMQQQRQGLAIGQQKLQQEQLQTSQQQGVQSFFQTWDPSEHVADDGSTDLDSALQSKSFKAAGNAKPAIMQALLDIKNKQLGNKQALATLNKDLVTQFGTGMGALAKDDDVIADKTDPMTGVNTGRAKIDQFLGNFGKLSPDAARIAQIYGPVTQHAPPGKLAKGVAAMQLQAQSASEQQAQQNPAMGSFDTGTQIVPYTANRATGIPQPTGQAVNKQSVVTTPAGPLAVATPARGTVAPLSTAGAPAAPPRELNTTRAAQENVQGMATDDRGRYAQISQEGTNAQTGAQLADQVAQLAEQVRTGKLSKEWTDQLTTLQQHSPGLTARQMLSKYAAQLKTMATQGATTDASRGQIDEGMPSPETMGPDAVKEAAQYVGGIFRMRGARQAYADQYTKNAGSSMGIRGADDAFMQAADPTVFTYNSLPTGAERRDFLNKHFGGDPNKIREFITRSHQVRHYAGSIE